MDENNNREKFFQSFFREFRAGLRIEDQPVIDSLITDLLTISQVIPPTNKQYSFREIIMLTAVINQKKIAELAKHSKQK